MLALLKSPQITILQLGCVILTLVTDSNGRFHKASLRLVEQNYWCKHGFSVKPYAQKEFRPEWLTVDQH